MSLEKDEINKLEKYVREVPYSAYVDMEDKENENFQLKSGITMRPIDNAGAYYEYDASKVNTIDIEEIIAAGESGPEP